MQPLLVFVLSFHKFHRSCPFSDKIENIMMNGSKACSSIFKNMLMSFLKHRNDFKKDYHVLVETCLSF